MTTHLAARYSVALGLASGDSGTDWRHRAACRGHDPELFFPVGKSPGAAAQEEEAKRVCRGCPVMDDCYQWSTDHGVTDGVWGGRSEHDRTSPKRYAERIRAHETLDRGRALALQHGRDILIGRRQGQSARDIARWTKTSEVVARQALRLLQPSGKLRNHGDTLERLMLNAGVLRDMVAAGRTDRQIASMMRTTPALVPAARQLLEHMDAAAAWTPEEAA